MSGDIPQTYNTPFWRKRTKVSGTRSDKPLMGAKMRSLMYQYTQEIKAGAAHKAVEAEMMRNCPEFFPRQISLL